MDVKITVALDGFNDLMKSNQASDKWCIIGSIALRVLGGIEVEPHDIDVEVLEDSNMESIFSNMAVCYGSTNHERSNNEYDMRAERRMKRPVTWGHKPFIFEIGGVRVNVWMVTKFSNRYVTLKNDLKFALPMDVLDRKLAYRRPKDMEFGAHLIKEITEMMTREGRQQ